MCVLNPSRNRFTSHGCVPLKICISTILSKVCHIIAVHPPPNTQQPQSASTTESLSYRPLPNAPNLRPTSRAPAASS